jgi:hypothetical protein
MARLQEAQGVEGNFGHKGDAINGEWRKKHNEELNDMYSPTIKSRSKGQTGNVTHMGDIRCVYRALVGKPEGKRPMGRPMRRWEDNINLLALLFGI